MNTSNWDGCCFCSDFTLTRPSNWVLVLFSTQKIPALIPVFTKSHFIQGGSSHLPLRSPPSVEHRPSSSPDCKITRISGQACYRHLASIDCLLLFFLVLASAQAGHLPNEPPCLHCLSRNFQIDIQSWVSGLSGCRARPSLVGENANSPTEKHLLRFCWEYSTILMLWKDDELPTRAGIWSIRFIPSNHCLPRIPRSHPGIVRETPLKLPACQVL